MAIHIPLLGLSVPAGRVGFADDLGKVLFRLHVFGYGASLDPLFATPDMAGLGVSVAIHQRISGPDRAGAVDVSRRREGGEIPNRRQIRGNIVEGSDRGLGELESVDIGDGRCKRSDEGGMVRKR
jgi:hypothetical protein